MARKQMSLQDSDTYYFDANCSTHRNEFLSIELEHYQATIALSAWEIGNGQVIIDTIVRDYHASFGHRSLILNIFSDKRPGQLPADI
jgi:hypothetical protein